MRCFPPNQRAARPSEGLPTPAPKREHRTSRPGARRKGQSDRKADRASIGGGHPRDAWATTTTNHTTTPNPTPRTPTNTTHVRHHPPPTPTTLTPVQNHPPPAQNQKHTHTRGVYQPVSAGGRGTPPQASPPPDPPAVERTCKTYGAPLLLFFGVGCPGGVVV